MFESVRDTPVLASAAVFWEPGARIWWAFDRFVRPMTVVCDDADALVAWLAPGAPILRPGDAHGAEIRTLPLDQRFREPWRVWPGRWRGPGVLKIAPVGTPWSVWLFWGDGWEFRGWYVNLEDPHVRDGRWTRTRDHVLDVWVDARREVTVKDADELDAAVACGWFTPAEAARFHERAAAVRELVARWGSPFRDGWEHWRPDPAWASRPPPGLPPGNGLPAEPPAAAGGAQRRSGGTS